MGEKKKLRDLLVDNSESLIRLVEILALIVAGLWVIFNYFTFTKEQQELSLQRERIQKEIEQLRYDQQQALKSTEVSIAETSLKLQELQLRERQLVSDLEIRKAELQNRALELENELKKGQVKFQSDSRFEPHIDLKVVQTNADYFEASLSFVVTNHSEGVLEISFSVIESFIGSIRDDSFSAGAILPLNPPAPYYLEPAEGIIDWKLIGRQAFQLDFEHGINNRFRSYQIQPEKSGLGAVARLKSGGVSYFTNQYIVRAFDGEYVGFVVSVGLNGGKTSLDRWYWYETRQLSEGKVEEGGK